LYLGPELLRTAERALCYSRLVVVLAVPVDRCKEFLAGAL